MSTQSHVLMITMAQGMAEESRAEGFILGRRRVRLVLGARGPGF